MAPHSSTLAWKIPWTEEPGRLQSRGSLRVRHDWATSLSLFCLGEGNGNPLQCSCLENPRDGGAWWAAVYGVAQCRTRLKWRSSSSSILLFRDSTPGGDLKAHVVQLFSLQQKSWGWTHISIKTLHYILSYSLLASCMYYISNKTISSLIAEVIILFFVSLSQLLILVD